MRVQSMTRQIQKKVHSQLKLICHANNVSVDERDSQMSVIVKKRGRS